MSLEKRVYSVLVASASERFAGALTELLPEADYAPIAVVSSAASARRELNQRAYDFIFVNSPLPDDSGERLAADSCRTGGAVALLFVEAGLYDAVRSRVVGRGVYLLPRPTPRGAMVRALTWMAATRERLRSYEKKVQPIEEKMDEIRLVNRAKWLLISELSMTESDAHHYITRQAMDRCVSKRAVAEEIIRLYQ